PREEEQKRREEEETDGNRNKDHIRDDERRSDGGPPSRARQRHRASQVDIRQELSARHQRQRGDRVERVRGSQSNRYADPARQVPEREPRTGARRDRRGESGVPGVERETVARARSAGEKSRGQDPRTPLGTVGADGLRGWQEPARMRR